MRRVIQLSLAGGLVFLAAAGLGVSVPGGAAEKPAAEHKNYAETIPDTKVSFDMVAIPGGKFTLGSPAGEAGRGADEGPPLEVTIKPFWMGKCEVTWDEYELFRKELGVAHWEDNEKILKEKPGAMTGPTPPYVDPLYGHGREGHPAICMTHHAAMMYCTWLSLKTKKAYRLPTEAEWEYAARAGTKTAYFFGDSPEKLGDYAWYKKNSEETTHKVGEKKPNPWGLHDVYGNVQEYCLDHYEPAAYATFAKEKLTLGPVVMPSERRYPHVVRGGFWDDKAEACRSAARAASHKDWWKDDPQKPQSIWWLTNIDTIGFRVVRAVEEQENLKDIRSKVTRQSR